MIGGTRAGLTPFSGSMPRPMPSHGAEASQCIQCGLGWAGSRRRTCQANGGSDKFCRGWQLVTVGERKKNGPVHSISTYFVS